MTRAILLGWDQEPVVISARYIRFTFISDSSSNDPGWNITLESSNYAGGDEAVVPYGTPLYVDTSDYSKLTETPGGGAVVGYTVSADSANDVIYAYLPR
jgi:hypothetical protein